MRASFSWLVVLGLTAAAPAMAQTKPAKATPAPQAAKKDRKSVV